MHTLDDGSDAAAATRHGVLVLSAWCLLNMVTGVGSLVFIFLGRHAPALQYLFTAEQVAAMAPGILAATDGVATLANTLIVVYCATALALVRRSLPKEEPWALVVLALGLLVVQVAGYVTDHAFFLGKNLLALHGSSLVILVGLGLCARGVFLRRRIPTSQAQRNETPRG